MGIQDCDLVRIRFDPVGIDRHLSSLYRTVAGCEAR